MLAVTASMRLRLLHVRGGVSALAKLLATHRQSSPRPWRCFLRPPLGQSCDWVFSTSVEVFPLNRDDVIHLIGLLHVRGGVSFDLSLTGFSQRSSPRPWRCFRASSGLA